ncbi:phosphoinositide 3-kinase regulatory subunit 4-like isoform X3 [Convolutriloba macropyga]|uniref:phosphoinositide 3-kinase regulatory subunit 4-like isoform X3 n=1 Tax=Convolutriloba macropyga TaxID=536237 RepID=UPI003F521F01
MGNNLAAIAPSQILPVEKYLEGHVFETHSLGSTRFMKVVRARSAPNVSIVAKVFVIPDPKLTSHVDSYKEANRLLNGKLIGEASGGKAELGLVGDCCLPYDYVVQDCNYSGRFLTRAYLASNLFDRLSTRPFLTTIERKFVAFQIIVAIARAHSKVVRHGDLKLENILLTSWNWVQVSDFAFFKPVYLPDNNPAGFNFYFDVSRRRTCNIAPERFISGGDTTLRDERFFDIVNSPPVFDSSGNYRDLMPSMDIFSLGCVIGQLFAETHLFDLSQLLSYKTGSGYEPSNVINKIPDEGIRQLVWDMIKVNPSERKSADEYLCEHRGVSFPEYFYSILYNFMRVFTTSRSSDRNIVLLSSHYPTICVTMRERGFSQQDLNDLTLIVFSLVLSNLRSIQVAHSKLCALRLIEEMCGNMDSVEILIRAVPCLVHFLSDASSKVVATAVSCLTRSLTYVTRVPRSQRKVFVEYIFPDLLDCLFTRTSKMTPEQLQSFCVESVLHEFIKCFPDLVQMSQKFLDLSVGNNNIVTGTSGTSTLDTDISFGGISYDEELRTLRNAVSEFYLPIFVKASGMTRQLFLEIDIVKLCLFHGNQPDQDPIAQYLPTCAPGSPYWPLNASYFRNIAKVCAYYGKKSSKHNVATFIEQGIHNLEEFVIVQALDTVRDLYEMNLIDDQTQKVVLFDKIMPFLLHPNPWIRLNSARAIAAASKCFGPTSARVLVHPKVNDYVRDFSSKSRVAVICPPEKDISTPRSLLAAYDRLNVFKAKYGITSVTNPSVLLSAIEPIRRFSLTKLYEFDKPLDQVLNYCENLVLVQNLEENHNVGSDVSSSIEFPSTFSEEDHELVRKLYFVDQSSGRGCDARPDLHKMKLLKEHICQRKTIKEQVTNKAENRTTNKTEQISGIPLPENTQVIIIKANDDHLRSFNRVPEPELPCSSTIKIATSGSPDTFSKGLLTLQKERPFPPLNFDKLKLFSKSSSVLSDNSTVEHFSNELMGPKHYTETPCMGYLRVLTRHWKKNNRRKIDYSVKQREKRAAKRVPPWRPNGSYVASLHDHSAAVNEIAVCPSNTAFASCSADGSCRIWNPSKWELNHQDPLDSSGIVNLRRGPVKSLAFLSDEAIVACLPDALQVINSDRTTANSKGDASKATWNAGLIYPIDEGLLVSMTTNENVVTASTNKNLIFGWDLRAKGLNNAYRFYTQPHDGLISAMVVADNGLCVVLGTSLGKFSVWDLRLLMPVKTFAPHTSLSMSKFKVPAVHRLKRHPFDSEAVIASMRGHNELAVWKLESGSRSKVFWSSSASPLDYQSGQVSGGTNNYAMGFYAVGNSEADFQIISGGSDKRVRFWDVSNPGRSYVISNSIQAPGVEQTFHYTPEMVQISKENNPSFSNKDRERNTEDVEVIRESIADTHRQQMFRRGPELPAFSHRDLVTDVNFVMGQSGTSYLLSSDMSGVIKVWK